MASAATTITVNNAGDGEVHVVDDGLIDFAEFRYLFSNLDLTQGGATDRFRLQITALDVPIDAILGVWGPAGVSLAIVNIPSGPPADFTDIVRIGFQIPSAPNGIGVPSGIGPFDLRMEQFDIIPEPSTALLLATGLAALAVVRRRRA